MERNFLGLQCAKTELKQRKLIKYFQSWLKIASRKLINNKGMETMN